MKSINEKYKMRDICRKVGVLLIMLFALTSMQAQPKKRPPFNPAKFEADLEQFITTQACLTPKEAAKFFPVYRQMMKRQRMLFDEMRRFRHVNPKDSEACADAIKRQDELDIQIKLIQQEYHGRFLMMLPAYKVFNIIKAEEKFHRQIFRKMK